MQPEQQQDDGDLSKPGVWFLDSVTRDILTFIEEKEACNNASFSCIAIWPNTHIDSKLGHTITHTFWSTTLILPVRILIMSLLFLATTTPVFAQQNKTYSPIPAGDYMCKVSKEYKLRPCTITVSKDGTTILESKEGLVGMRGALLPVEGKKKRAHFTGSITDSRPFGCYNCSESCAAKPETCMCKEVPKEASAQCTAQPLMTTFTKKGSSWKGMLPYKTYSVVYTDGKPSGYEVKVTIMEVMIKKSKKSKKATK